MKQRVRTKHSTLISHGLARALLVFVLISCVYGFIYCSHIAIVRQEHLPPGAEHPWDFEADGWLGICLVLLAVYFLSARTPKPRWLPQRVTRVNAWRRARTGGHPRPISGKMAKRRRRVRGTIK